MTPEPPTVDDLAPLLMTANDLAHMLAVSRLTIWRWRSAGRLPPPLRIGRVVRWKRSEIETWLAAGCPSCRPAARR